MSDASVCSHSVTTSCGLAANGGGAIWKCDGCGALGFAPFASTENLEVEDLYARLEAVTKERDEFEALLNQAQRHRDEWMQRAFAGKAQLAAATQRAERLEADLAALRAAVETDDSNVRAIADEVRDGTGLMRIVPILRAIQAIASRASQRAGEMGERR